MNLNSLRVFLRLFWPCRRAIRDKHTLMVCVRGSEIKSQKNSKRRSRSKGFSFIEVLLSIIIITVFASSALIVLSKATGAPLMFYLRSQALNLARARINELLVVPKSILNQYNGIIENEHNLGYQFKRKTEISMNGMIYHIKVTVTNGSFNNDGTLGKDVVLEVERN